MTKLLSATALAAMLAIGGTAWAQNTGQAGQAAGAQSGANQSGANQSGQASGNQTGGNPATMSPGQTSTMAESEVRDRLAKQGFTNIENITRDGNSFQARATQNGRAVDLTIDATSGTITSNTAAR